MIFVVDTSSLQRYLAGLLAHDTQAVADAMAHHEVHVPPVVVTEALSNHLLTPSAVLQILAMPVLKLTDGYWLRAGRMRADLLRYGLKAKLADTLIAQSCIDHDLPLITYDDDFRNFVPAGLKLL